MNYIGRKKMINGNRIGIPLSVTKALGFSNYVSISIKDGNVYATPESNNGFVVSFERSTGRITIPAPIQKALNIEHGDELDIYVANDCVVLKKVKLIREIEIVRQLSIISDTLSTDEKNAIHIILDKLLVEEKERK